MENKKRRTRGFQPRGLTEKRIETLEKLNVNISEFINEVLEKDGGPHFEAWVKRRKAELREALTVTLP